MRCFIHLGRVIGRVTIFFVFDLLSIALSIALAHIQSFSCLLSYQSVCSQ